jgi:hypothetical protein
MARAPSGLDVLHRRAVELALADAPGEELPTAGAVAVLGGRRDLALEAHQPAADVGRGDGGHVVDETAIAEPGGELDGGAGVVVERLRTLTLGLEGELEAGQQPLEGVGHKR